MRWFKGDQSATAVRCPVSTPRVDARITQWQMHVQFVALFVEQQSPFPRLIRSQADEHLVAYMHCDHAVIGAPWFRVIALCFRQDVHEGSAGEVPVAVPAF